MWALFIFFVSQILKYVFWNIDHFNLKMKVDKLPFNLHYKLINAIRFNWVNFQKNSTLYALTKLTLWKFKAMRMN